MTAILAAGPRSHTFVGVVTTWATLPPAVDAGPVFDTTGAGDAICGAFAAALAEGRSPADAARFASACAGI